MSDQSNLCTRCGADNLRDGYFCRACDAEKAEAEADVVNFRMSRTATQQRAITINRLCNLAADDYGERFIPATDEGLAAAVARIEGSGEATW